MEPRDGILKAAQVVFARHGFRQTSMTMVAEEAGLSRQALYHHFASKEELFARLKGRASETDQSLAVRLKTAEEEMARVGEYDQVVVNDTLEHALEMLKEIRRSEHSKRGS